MQNYEHFEFPTKLAAIEFATKHDFTLKDWSSFPPDEKTLSTNQCFLIPYPLENPREWKLICNTVPKQGNKAKPL